MNTDSDTQKRLAAMQQAVAQLEVEQSLLQRRTTHLEKKIERLRTERQHLRETLTQVGLWAGIRTGGFIYHVNMIHMNDYSTFVFCHHQVELERGKLRHQLSLSEAGIQVIHFHFV